MQGWGAGAGGRVFLAPWSRSRLKKNRSRSRLENTSGAGAARKISRLAPQPREKIKSIRKLYLSYSSLGKIVSFYY